MTINAKEQRLRNLLERLLGGEDVAARDLRSALTEGEFDYFQEKWKFYKEAKAGNVVSGSSGYEEWLKKGIFHYNKAESKRFSEAVRKRFYAKAEKCFEKGLEQLRADLASDPSIASAYDRPLDFSHQGYSFSLSPAGMPRPISSRSLDNQGGAFRETRKRDLKIQVVKESLENFAQRFKHEKARGKKREKTDTNKREKGADEPMDRSLLFLLERAKRRLQKG